MAIEVGKDVVAIRDHNQGQFKKGDIFPCIGLRPSKCKCPRPEINIGLRTTLKEQYCPICLVEWKSEPFWWFDTKHFRALDDITPSIEEIIKEIAPLELTQV